MSLAKHVKFDIILEETHGKIFKISENQMILGSFTTSPVFISFISVLNNGSDKWLQIEPLVTITNPGFNHLVDEYCFGDFDCVRILLDSIFDMFLLFPSFDIVFRYLLVHDFFFCIKYV